MQKYLLDGNIFDQILVDQEAKLDLEFLSNNESIRLMTTWIIDEEIEKISEFVRREKIREIIKELRVAKVPVAGLVLDNARLEETCLIPWAEAELLQLALSLSKRDDNDMALAMSAKNYDAKLVTSDKRLLRKSKRLFGVQAINWVEFLEDCRVNLQ